MPKGNKLNSFSKRAILISCVALLAVAMVLLDIPSGLRNIVLGNPNIPKDFGKTQALDIAFFDVGQGDSSIIGCNGKYVLIDAGENDKGYQILRYLDKLKVKKIDIMILTHPHSDHIGGADVIVERMKIGSIYMPDAAIATLSFESVLDAIKENDIEVYVPEVGDKLDLNGMLITFLHPAAEKEFENMNDVSIMIKAENSYGSALFTGDGEAEAERNVMETGLDIAANVLKVGHHGSSTSTSEEFLRAIDPDYAVISCGEYNEFGHPHDEVTDMLESFGINIYITYEEGNVYFSFSQEGVRILPDR